MLKVTWSWKCDVCGEEKTEENDGIQIGYTFLRLGDLPSGWSWVDGKMVCGKHKITIEEPVVPAPADLWWVPTDYGFELKHNSGRVFATVWTKGMWHTWDKNGVGGENGVAKSVGTAIHEAMKALLRQGWVRP
jgi:hypothetical protein